MDACHEIGIKVPIYLTGGLNNLASSEHPEWREISPDGQYAGWSKTPLAPGFHKMCFNTPYLDYLCALLREAVTLFPDADGVFIDIISQGQCCCPRCMEDMQKQGFDPENEADRKRFARQVLMNYYRRSVESVRCRNANMPVFHNSGNMPRGDREILPYFSHLELESLPTGGWGYDHYPMSAAYSRKLGLEFLGMTGKFHTSWGEFGGFKHVNALRYECSAMLAQGSKCSIGDQLHPCGKLDRSTYRIIGQAYREVAGKEPWCDHVESGAVIAVLGEEAVCRRKGSYPGDTGAARLLFEMHQPFDCVDTDMSFDQYKMLILPDTVRPDEKLTARLKDYIARGGRLVLSGASGMKPGGGEFLFDTGSDGGEESPFGPDYLLPESEFAPENMSTPFVMYAPSRRIKVRPGVRSLGKIYDPYFNRSYRHFSSHQHTPYRPECSGFDAGSMTSGILYFAHPVFSIYRKYGTVILKQFIEKAMRAFAGNDWQIVTDMPSQGRVTVMDQPQFDRRIVHLLYVNTILRGGLCSVPGGDGSSTAMMEIIEDLNPSPPVHLSIAEDRPARSVRIVPEGREIAFTQRNGRLEVNAGAFTCHRMLEIRF
ncbi:MAG: beta-galactosidase trimerization domain-containing protein, partial [Lentisphaeria bacterium]|nr:beta-galactosidase trimerization domain-containing protein [Lentisphaeria bacterium]